MGVGAGLYMYDVVVKMFTFTISSTDEFLELAAVVCHCPNQYTVTGKIPLKTIFGRPFVKRFALFCRTVVLSVCLSCL